MSFNAGDGSNARTMTRITVGTGATYREIQSAYVGDGTNARLVFQAFSGDIREYTTADTNPGTDTIPNGATSVTITVYGAGAKGGDAEPQDSDWLDGAGGQGGGKAVKTIAIDPAAWGEQFTYRVGSSSDGTQSQVDGTLTAGTVNIDVGGDASGGDTNSNGANGTGGGTISGPGGSGGNGVDGVANGGNGAPGVEDANGDFGGDGLVRFEYE